MHPIHQILVFHHHLYNVHAILEYISKYGYAFVFLGTVFEGELILLLAGFLCWLGALNFFAVILFGFFGAIVGDNIWYHVGKRGGIPFIERYGKLVLLTRSRIRRAEKYFSQHGAKTIFFSRFVFGTRISTAILAGAFKMPMRKFMRSNIAGAAVWSIITIGLGFVFGNYFEVLRKAVQRTELALLILAGSIIIILILRFLVSSTSDV